MIAVGAVVLPHRVPLFCRFWAQQDLVGLLREEPRWTSGLLRRWQQLHFTNLKRFSRFGAPTTERLGRPLRCAQCITPHMGLPFCLVTEEVSSCVRRC